MPIDINGPDPCLGYLPGVIAACCGHGKEHGMVKFENGIAIYFPWVHMVIPTCMTDGGPGSPRMCTQFVWFRNHFANLASWSWLAPR